MYWDESMGSLSVGGESLIWDGGEPLDLEVLWSAGEWEFENHEHPGVDGALPRDGRMVEAVHDVRFHLSTVRMPDGDLTDNYAAAARANYRELCDRIGTPKTWGGRTVLVEVETPEGELLSGDCQVSVSRLPSRARGSVIPVTVTFVIPAGELTVADDPGDDEPSEEI